MPIVRSSSQSPESIARENKIATRILDVVRGESRVEIEVALLIAYCNVANGVQAYPPATRSARAQLVVEIGLRALCAAVEHVATVSDIELPTTTTCRH